MRKEGALVLLFLTAVIQLLVAQPYKVNKIPMMNCKTGMGMQDFPSSVGRGEEDAPCQGLLTYNLNGFVRRVCSEPESFNQASAMRLCFTLGLDMDRFPGTNTGVRLYHCDAYVEEGAPLPNSDSIQVNEADISTLYEKRCNEGVDVASYDCFDQCYFGEAPGSTSLPYSETQRLCDESKEPYWGVVCSDVNECLNGVLFGCKGPFDESCTQRKACGGNATCTNIVGSYECACMNGYKPAGGEEIDPYFLDKGCVDVNECEEELTCGMTGRCQNTLGSYICLCPQGQFWSDETRTCGGSMCGPSINDPNAETPVFQGSPVERATYQCKKGYKAPGNTDSYTNDCTDGIWEDNGYCTDVDECDPSQCDPNAICTNFPGSFICRCNDGYGGNGRTCIENDPCDGFTFCLNGECTVVNGNPECRCDSGYTGPVCDQPRISTPLIVAIAALVLVALLFLLCLFYMCCRVLRPQPTPTLIKPAFNDVYGSGPVLAPRRGPFRLPPFPPRF